MPGHGINGAYDIGANIADLLSFQDIFAARSLGQIGNRCWFNDQTGISATTNMNAINVIDLFDDGDSLSIWIANYKGINEATLGAATGTLQMQVELNANGTIIPVTWSALSTAVLGGTAAILKSDPINIRYRKGDKLYVKLAASYAGGLPFMSKSSQSAGDRTEFSASALTNRMPNTIAQDYAANWGNSGSGAIFRVQAVVAQTRVNSLGIIGDSLQAIPNAGTADNPAGDPSGLVGQIARSTGMIAPFLSVAVGGSQMNGGYLSNHVHKDEFLAITTHKAIAFATNDFLAGSRTGAQALTDLASVVAFYSPTSPVTVLTMPPISTSSDSWATTANQTASTHAADINTYNEGIRAGVVGVSNIIDINRFLSVGENTNIRRVTGAANGWTADGIHDTKYANLAIAAANLIRIPGITHGNLFRKAA